MTIFATCRFIVTGHNRPKLGDTVQHILESGVMAPRDVPSPTIAVPLGREMAVGTVIEVTASWDVVTS